VTSFANSVTPSPQMHIADYGLPSRPIRQSAIIDRQFVAEGTGLEPA